MYEDLLRSDSTPSTVSLVGETSQPSPVSLAGKTDPGLNSREANGAFERRLRDARSAQLLRRDSWVERTPETHKCYVSRYNKAASSKSVLLTTRSLVRGMRAAIAYCLNLKFIQVEPWDDIGLLRQYGQLQAFERATNSRRKVVKGGTRAKDEDSGYQELADYLRSTGISVSGPVSGVFPARQGRVGSLRKLPRDWRERIIAATESRIPNLKEAVTSMAANGCRPGEVASTEISTSEGGDLCITVVTLKSPKAPKRGAIFPVNENTKRLVNLAGPPDQPFAPFGHVGAKQLANSLRRISLKVFPDVQPPICPSSFRNQAASDAKQAGATREQIALLLGHTCDEEQKVYGRARYGSSKGGWAPKAVLQSHDVQLNRPLMDFWDQEQPDRNYPSERA